MCLCGLFHLGVLLCVLYLRTIFVVRQNGLGAVHVVELLASLLSAVRFASTRHRVPICFREVYSVVLVNVPSVPLPVPSWTPADRVTGMLIVLEVLGQDAVQMPFVEHDDVIQTIAAYAADHSFAIRILPG